MRRSIVLVPFALAFFAPASLAHGQGRGEAKLTLAGKAITIDYGRPSLKGRDMLAQLQPGQNWRMGADAATTLKTAADLSFGSAQVAKGDYTLSAKRSADNKWILVVASSGGQVAAEVPLAEQKLPEAVEVFTIELSGEGNQGRFVMKWGVSALSAPFTAE